MPNNAQPSTSGSKKMWWIIGGIIVVLVIGWMLTRSASFMMMQAAGVNVQPGANGATTYSNAQGSVTVGGTSMPDNWPSDAPGNYAGASIQYSGSSNPQTGQTGSVVVYTVQASAQDVANYYKTQFASEGWTIENTAQSGGTTIISAKKDTRTFGLSISDTGSGMLQVTIGIGM